MNILGISCFYHDSAACLVRDGDVVAAAQEERFSRKKHDSDFPKSSINFCLRFADLSIDEIDYVAFYDKPFIKFERILETYLSYAPRGLRSYLMALPLWIKQKLWIPDIIEKETGYRGEVLFCEHHFSHAASAFFPSPFERAAFLTMDGVGEWTTTSFGTGEGNLLQIESEMHFPHSLGLLYSSFTYYTGFKVNSGEYKVMGLAPYGEPKYVQTILENLIDLKEDGSFKLNMDYFGYCAGLTMTNSRFNQLFGGKPRAPECPIGQREMDLAHSVQAVTEEIMLRMTRHVHHQTGENNLCLAGGVALNCVGNGRILQEGPFKNIWIQPAAGDAGGALGAALFVWHQYLKKVREKPIQFDFQKGSLLGPEFSNDDIRSYLDKARLPYTELKDQQLFNRTSELIDAGHVVGWFQGRMEFGPRALGSRSILGDPRSADMQKKMNLKIKYRESFRPFAPAVLESDVSDYFELNEKSPYMLLVASIADKHKKPIDEKQLTGLEKLQAIRSDIAAVTHVDYSARIQTVDQSSNPRFYQLINAFKNRTGCPVLINTSFNVRGEPIVCTPEDAYRCFMRTQMDFLVLGNFVLNKKKQPHFSEEKDWRKDYELD